MMKYCLILALLGIALIGYASTMPALKNAAEYEAKYLAIEPSHSSEYATREFSALRRAHLTQRYMLEDYGKTLILFALISAYILKKGGLNFTNPNKRFKIILLGVAAVISTTTFEYLALTRDFERGEFPHWADSLAIPLMWTMMFFPFHLLWIGVHMLLMRKKFSTSAPLFQIKKIHQSFWNVWLASLIILVMIFVIISALKGNYYGFGSSVLWLYFYLSLLAGRTSYSVDLATNDKKSS